MRMVIGVDWSEEAFAAVQLATALFESQAVTLVHGVDLGWLQYPVLAEAGNVPGYDDFRHAMQESGRQLLSRTADLVSRDIPAATRILEIAKPDKLVLDTAERLSADMIAVGGGSRGRVAEWFLGSVSHRIALHAPCTTLVAKQCPEQVSSILVAAEEEADARQLTAWLKRFPFRPPVSATVLRVIQPIPEVDGINMLPVEPWREAAHHYADRLVHQVATELGDRCASITTQVLIGDPVDQIAEAARKADLLVVGSHARSGVARLLLGSVAHALLHRSPCSVLIVR